MKHPTGTPDPVDTLLQVVIAVSVTAIVVFVVAVVVLGTMVMLA